MSSSCSSSPPTVPLKYRRKSPSASAIVSVDGVAVLSSSPLLTPLHLTRQYGSSEWDANDRFHDLHSLMDDLKDKSGNSIWPWPCHAQPEYPIPIMHRPLPSLMSKFTAYPPQSNPSCTYDPLLFSPDPKTTFFGPRGDSAISDDCEEHDLESMDIHIRETYFATSAERGRWLSSPIAPRVRAQAIPPMRGHSSPAKTLVDISPVKDSSSTHKRSRSIGRHISTSSLEDRDEDMRYPSSLPPSSPLTSPISNHSILGDDFEDDFIVDPCLNSDSYHSPTPALSISYTTCTSPAELTRTPSPQEIPAIVPAFEPTNPPCHTPSSVTSNPFPGQSPAHIDIHVSALAGSQKPEDVLSPLSQFELDLLEEESESSKPPLSDVVNKPRPWVRSATPGLTVDVTRHHIVPPPIQSLSIQRSLDLSPGVTSESSCKRKTKKKQSVTKNPEAKQTRKRSAVRSESMSLCKTKRKGTESCKLNHSTEPANKKTRLSHKRYDKDLPSHGGTSEDERPADASSGSPCSHDRKAFKRTVDAEFHVSLTGMLIEAFATSRATSMDSSTLYLIITQAHPYLAAERSKEEFLIAMTAVLEAGRARCGMFEKVDSSGEKSRRNVFEGRWFYVPERDEDQERASLMSAIMPRQKRNETKKYKQYYYQPLDKISRWDPEDAP